MPLNICNLLFVTIFTSDKHQHACIYIDLINVIYNYRLANLLKILNCFLFSTNNISKLEKTKLLPIN